MTESIAVLKYRKKPVLIEAIQWWPNAGVHHDGVWCDQEGPDAGRPYVITIHNQRAYLAPGDWILPEPKPGHFYPCKPDIFQNTYEPEEIAGHTEASGYAASLLQWAEWIDQRKCDLEEIDTEELRKSAAALRAQAQEVERLEDHWDKLAYENKDLRARIAEIEADLKQHAELNAAEHAFMLQYRSERDAIKAKTREECALIADRYATETPDDSLRQGAKWIAEDIRALNQPEASSSGKE